MQKWHHWFMYASGLSPTSPYPSMYIQRRIVMSHGLVRKCSSSWKTSTKAWWTILKIICQEITHTPEHNELNSGEIGFSRYLQRCGHAPAELLALRHLATHAVSQTTLAAKDTVFEAGTVAHEAHFLAHGSFEHLGSQQKFLFRVVLSDG